MNGHAIGGGLGGAAGAAIGNEVGGRDGAIAGAALLHRGRRTPDAGLAGAGAEWAADPCALPEDARISWIPGPAGSLRLVERRPAGGDRRPIGGGGLPVVYVHGLGGGRRDEGAQKRENSRESSHGIAWIRRIQRSAEIRDRRSW